MAGRSSPAGRLPDRVRSHLDSSDLLPPGQPVVVAVSGGLDSMVLLHLLRFPLRDLDLTLSVAHVDHAMRPDSESDADWVAGSCRAWGITFHRRRLDPPAVSEADARDRRYAYLEEVANDVGADRIATGHHSDDQAETVLFRAIRGTGLRGLRGIAARRGRIVRPLLPFRRDELRQYGDSVGLRHRVDPTNRTVAYARNRIRHEVMPALEALRPGAARSLAHLADRARETERALSAMLERLEGEVVLRSGSRGAVLARPVLHSYHPALRVRLLRYLLRRYGSTPDRAGTQAALEFISSGPSGGELHVAGGVRLERDFDEIRIVSPTEGDAPDGDRSDRALSITDRDPGSGRARIGGRWIDVAWGSLPVGADSAGAAVATGAGWRRATLIDPVFPLTIRGWVDGDRIRFHYGRKKLKALFREQRLDRRARRAVPVVEDGTGEIVWVAGIARADSVSGDDVTGEGDVGFQIAVRDARQR